MKKHLQFLCCIEKIRNFAAVLIIITLQPSTGLQYKGFINFGFWF